MKNILKLIRVNQWSKNILIFFPLLFGLGDLNQIFDLLFGFFLFSIIASSIYIFNDLIDKDEDKKHPLKSERPIASGSISVSNAYILLGLFLSSSLVTSYLFLPTEGFYIILAYLGLNSIYSLSLKKFLILDLVLLSNFYLLRIVFGSTFFETEISGWLLIFTNFFFLALVSLKRLGELRALSNNAAGIKSYIRDDEIFFIIVSIGSAMCSVIFYALYLSNILDGLGNISLILLTIPILMVSYLRIILILVRKNNALDPLSFVLKDIPTLVYVASFLAIFYLGINL
ncbi:MAG: UbiA prenyltransferase family protein [SAR86 cluster bacterium]|nr:UbiA prenyltransferase family protein [SAR86 cluster bacterium]